MEKDGATKAPRAATPQQDHQDHQDQQQHQKQAREGITSSSGSTSPARKRRKDRPCARCVKRNIGHLCHDEPREAAKNAKVLPGDMAQGDDAALKQDNTALLSVVDEQQVGQQLLQEPDLDLSTTAPANGQTGSAQLAEPPPASGAPGEPSGPKSQPLLGRSDWSLGGQNQFQDMHNFHPSYMFNAPEVTNEYNLLNDFLSTSLLDDGAMFSADDAQGLYSDPSLINTVAANSNGHRGQRFPTQPSRFLGRSQTPAASTGDVDGPSIAMPADKARENYYMTAADPAGNDTPEERMEKLLKAKYRAGMLRPFNYVKGYARLNEYMDKHMQPASRQKILRELDRFRPKFRERMQTLTDMELVLVEMWFERSLMEYDRVFASMAIPACCWRRTGEIFRGNKEMAQLIHVPIEQLRDGKLAIHEIIIEEHLVSYWEKFGKIAFDNSQKAIPSNACSGFASAALSPTLGDTLCLKSMASIVKSHPKDITKCSRVLGRYLCATLQRQCLCGNLTRGLVFAAKLERTLHEAVDTLPSLTASLYENIEKVDLISASAIATKNRDLDGRGTRIWNLTSMYKDNTALAETLALVRAFASLLLDCAQQSGPGATANDIRVLKITLKASKWCLDQGQLGVAEQVIERAACYEQRLQRRLPNNGSQDLAPTRRQLASQYHILRISLAWRRDRLDIADFFFAKLNAAGIVHEATVAEDLADILFEIGRDLATKQSYSAAIQWLERAHGTLISQTPEDLSTDASALRGCIVHTLVHALLKQRCEENNLRAWNIIRELERETENPITVSLLKLQVLTGDQSSAQDYHDVLVRVIRQIHLSDLNVKTILHHVHELRRRSARLAHSALAALLSERLLAINEIAWVERTLITILWNCTTSTDLGDMTDQLKELLSQVASGTHSTLTTSATHAAQILMLRRIETFYSQGDYDQADVWCRLALHNIFSNSGTSNVGKLQRKRLLCALAKADFATCRNIHHHMSKSTVGDLSTKYLVYKVALRTKDVATACLDAISAGSQSDFTLLYACVLEAQKNGNRLTVIRALSRVLDKRNYATTSDVHLATLLRFVSDDVTKFLVCAHARSTTARLLIEELDSPKSQEVDCIGELCKVFEAAAAVAEASQQQGPGAKDDFPIAELDWFSRNSYNLALNICTMWEAGSTLRIVQACLAFTSVYLSNGDPQQASDLALRRLFCNFLGCCLLTILARAEDSVEKQLHYYSSLRNTMSGFRAHVGEQLSRMEGGARTDLLRKYGCLIMFDFEAAARMGSWTCFGNLINVHITCVDYGGSSLIEQETSVCKDVTIYNVMADVVLAGDAPTEGNSPRAMLEMITYRFQLS
ncbi:MAG: hypothetical protein Q9211_001005 [Gyalolechia sp. 1 TL-2023]